MLQCVTVYRSASQCVAVFLQRCCSDYLNVASSEVNTTIHCVAVCCSVLQCAAVLYSLLQR